MSNKLKNKQKKQNSMYTIGREFAGYLLDLMISIYMLAVIVVMPFYNQEGFSHIGTDKYTFFKQISITFAWFVIPTLVVFVLFWIIENGKKIKVTLSGTDKFALLYVVMLILSYVCSDYKENALWGAGGWYMGLFTQLVLVAIYFLLSRCWEIRNWQVLLFLPVSAIVFVLGYLNRFDVFPFDMQVDNVQFISTIGNINWYCGYLVSVFFGGCYLFWHNDVWNQEKKIWQQALLGLYVAIGFATLVTQGSMSGLFTLAVILVVGFCLSVKEQKRMLLFWQQVLLLSLACLMTYIGRKGLNWQITYTDGVVELLTNSILPVFMTVVSIILVTLLIFLGKRGYYPYQLFRWTARIGVVGVLAAFGAFVAMIAINTLHPGSLGSLSEYAVFTFSPSWGSNRATTWKAGLMCFAEQNILHKLVGVGPDSMSSFLYQAGSEELKQTVNAVFGQLSLTNAHNEWITILVNTGIGGLVGFVGMVVSAMVRFIKLGMKKQQLVSGACGFCLLAYTVNNMFSFQQSMSVATIFVILGIGEAYARSIRLLWFINGKNREDWEIHSVFVMRLLFKGRGGTMK